MTHLLDTNACIVHLRSAASSVSNRLAAHRPGDVVLCSVVKAELLFGALRSSRSHENLSRVRFFFSGFDSLPFDDAAADFYGNVRLALTTAGKLIGPNDLLIASIALAHDLTLVTHNVGEFSRVPRLRIEDWEAGP